MKLNVAIMGTLLAVYSASSASSAPVTYELNQDHVDVAFRINHAGFTMKHGSFSGISGALKLDAEHIEGSSVDITIAVNSIATNNAKRDQMLQSSRFLDAAQYPTMHFVSTKVVQQGSGMLDVVGDLTLHGVTKPLTLHAKVNKIGKSPFGNKQTAGFSATGTLNRTDFGIAAMVPMIGDQVELDIDAEFAVPKAE
jgi:polyisoprenoid-binding protein YceI